MLPKTLLLPALLPVVLAVKLEDFTPRASNLPSQCQSVYTAQIPMCEPTDFQTRKCSRDCVNAINALRASVSKACNGVTGNNILVALINGKGTQDLCPNAADYDEAPSSSAPPATTSTPTPTPSSTMTTTTTPSTTSASMEESSSSQRTTVIVTTGTVIPQPSDTVVPTSIEFDRSSPTGSSASSTQTPATNINNNPFTGGVEPGMERLQGGASAGRPASLVLAAAVVGAVMLTL